MKRIRWRVAPLLFSAAVALSWMVHFAVQQERQRESQAVLDERGARTVKIIAHRGGAACAPENTLAALEVAVEMGADLAEIDLRMTKDGVPIALHDETLARTTGLERLVYEVDSQAVRELDAGYWFSSEFEGERIPTLTELLKTAQGRIRLILELKQTEFDQMLLERTVAQIRSMGMEAECILASTSLEVLRRGKELAPELKNIYIGENTEPELWELSYVDGYSICVSALTDQDVERAHQRMRELYVWTVNEPWEMEEVLAMGADGLVTDNPALALELLNKETVEIKD